MRLLKIRSVSNDGEVDFDLVTVYQTVPYAILSHTWDPDPDKEFLFEDVQNGTGKTKPGYEKVKGFLAAAWRHGSKFEYGWVDTCCIDKSSSAELSEAINSMFRWYADARTCFAHLADLPGKHSPVESPEFAQEFGDCRWFGRGWTLQELLAPPELAFYSMDWKYVGTRNTLPGVVSDVTGIHEAALGGKISTIQDFSIAQRMSWASDRHTTRREDMAYCLLGIFDVNMPLLYGEGDKAFLRLQEEIIKDSDDQTIFCWQRSEDESEMDYSFFADSPSDFIQSHSIIPIRTGQVHTYQLTNAGLRINARLQERKGKCRLLLHCRDEESPLGFLKLFVKRVSPGSNQFVRISGNLYRELDDDSPETEMYLCKKIPRHPPPWLVGPEVTISLHDWPLAWRIEEAYPPNRWNETDKVFSARDLQAKSNSLTNFSWHVTTRFGLVWKNEYYPAAFVVDTGYNGVSNVAWCDIRKLDDGKRWDKKDSLRRLWKHCSSDPNTRIQQVSKVEMGSGRTLCCRLKDVRSRGTPKWDLIVDIE